MLLPRYRKAESLFSALWPSSKLMVRTQDLTIYTEQVRTRRLDLGRRENFATLKRFGCRMSAPPLIDEEGAGSVLAFDHLFAASGTALRTEEIWSDDGAVFYARQVGEIDPSEFAVVQRPTEQRNPCRVLAG